MAKKKEKEAPPTFTPGQAITVKCISPSCKETMTLVPSSENAIPSTMNFICVACGGLKTKFKMPEEKAEDVDEKDKDQLRLD